MNLNSNPKQQQGPYLPLTNKQKFEREFVFFLPDHKGLFQVHEDRNGREYVSRCICGVWQFDYAIEMMTDKFVMLERDGHLTMVLFSELKFNLS